MTNCRPPLILIAADDQALRHALQFALQLEGMSVHAHSDGLGLLTDPDLSRAACFILDDQQPHFGGFEILDQLLARDMRMPIILLTSNATNRLHRRAARAGVHKVLEKPLLDNGLAETVWTILGGGREVGHFPLGQP